jgi:transposase
MHEEYISRFIGIPGHRLFRICFLDESGRETLEDSKVTNVIIELKRSNSFLVCTCGRRFDRYYDMREQLVRDLPWGEWQKVSLRIPRYRVLCPDCGVKTEPLDFLVRNCTYTRRLAEVVAFACDEVRSIAAIAESFDPSWNTVKDIDRKRLERELNPPNFSGLRHMAMDEFAIRKGHEYATVFLDVERNKVLWVCRTRKKEAVEEVFTKVFGKEVCQQIEAVAMDCWAAYEGAVKKHLPNAEIVWDMFHIIRNYNKDVIDRVRRQEAYAKLGKEAAQFKNTRFLVLKNRRNLKNDEPARLEELFKVNLRIFKVHMMADVLRKLWDYKYTKCAHKWFDGWYQRAKYSKIEPLKRFAEKLKKRINGIIAHCKYPIHTGVLEGINNKIKVIKRVAYGYRDDDYFFLKVRRHFSGSKATPL